MLWPLLVSDNEVKACLLWLILFIDKGVKVFYLGTFRSLCEGKIKCQPRFFDFLQ